MSHRNAPLTPEGRRRLCERVDAGQPIAHVAKAAGISRQCLSFWYGRWCRHGEAGLHDRSSRPQTSPRRTPVDVEARIELLRRERKLGPVQIAGILQAEGISVAHSTVHRVLQRLGISRLRDLDPSGENLRQVIRYEHDAPGELIHLDVKKIGRIPDGGGWRVHGRGSAAANAARASKAAQPRRVGYVYVHTALDDHSRLAYSEELPDEKGTTAAAFWHRAAAFFADHGITTIKRCLTDNGPCYLSVAFGQALLDTATSHKRTLPYRPQTNGKVERFHLTLAREWAHAAAYTRNDDRTAALPGFLNHHNRHRPHTALAGRPPITRCPAVTNVPG
jgi:transposase InsO family protein